MFSQAREFVDAELREGPWPALSDDGGLRPFRGHGRGAARRFAAPVPGPPAEPASVVMVGTYPPTACGVATFTANLRSAIVGAGNWSTDIVRIVDRPEERPDEVVGEWVVGDRTTLLPTLDAMSSYDAVVLQHEYGLFGGDDGEDVLDLVDGIDVPLVAVLHTALLHPSPNQRLVLERIMAAACTVIVQSQAARQRLMAVHDVDPGRVVAIPHGAAANFAPARPYRTGAPVVLTWGLLGPGKGIERAIAAVATMHDNGLDVNYVVAGQIHPKVRAASGDRYRDEMIELAHALGVAEHVSFDDGYRDWESLRTLVRSADVVLLPYDSLDQVSSGVLVEAVASAKPVVATRFPHAQELLAGGAGVTVAHGDVEAMAGALTRVLCEPEVARGMAVAARREAEALLWPSVGAAYRSVIGRAAEARLVGQGQG